MAIVASACCVQAALLEIGCQLENHDMQEIEEMDLRGLICPLPVLRLNKRIRGLASGSTVRVLVDDPAARVDIPHFCHESGHALLNQEDCGDHQSYTICKKS